MTKRLIKKAPLSKKSFLRISAALIIVFLSLSFLKFFYGVSAQSDLKNKKYEQAAQKYSFLITVSPANKDYKAKYAQSLANMPFDYETQRLICNFLEKYEDESFSNILKDKVKRFKENFDYQIGPNYIEKVSMNNQIVRWEDNAFPLKVYIDTNNSDYVNIIQKAFDYWSYATKNFVSFTYVNKRNDANIEIEVLNKAKSNCQDGGCYYVAALTSPIIKNNILTKMNMKLYTSDPQGRFYTPRKFYTTTLHEIGHALGIMGHSSNSQDLMYSSGQHTESDYFAEHRSVISRQDFNTLNYLYMIVPNISNSENHITKNKIHPNVILGTSKEIKRRNIEDALEYINQAPNLAIGYLDLGNAYTQAERYDKALQAYKQGFDLGTDNNEKYLFVYNMALTSLKLGDKEKALEYAFYAQKLYPTEDVEKLIKKIKSPIYL